MKHPVEVASHLLFEEGDDETTQLTETAKAVGAVAVAGWCPRTAQYVEVDDEWMVLEVVSQAPDHSRHRHGMRHERLLFLQDLSDRGTKVLLAFSHGPNRWARAWLHTLPKPESIRRAEGDRDAGRVGWYAGEDEER